MTEQEKKDAQLSRFVAKEMAEVKAELLEAHKRLYNVQDRERARREG